jgi:glycosyltransferase involved in cell wall biosynthesis
MNVQRTRVFQGFNAVQNDLFRQVAITNRRRYELPSTQHNVIFVGQLIQRKNIHTALDAWVQTRGQQDLFFVVGNGPKKHKLVEIAKNLQILDKVIFFGYQSSYDIGLLFSISKTLILPSTEEVWGLVVNEALAAGLQAVVSQNCGVSTSIRKMPGVFLCEPSVESVTIALKRSRDSWQGYFEEPQILQFTPEILAKTFEEAIKFAFNQSNQQNC